jgi:hypothetical protein
MNTRFLSRSPPEVRVPRTSALPLPPDKGRPITDPTESDDLREIAEELHALLPDLRQAFDTVNSMLLSCTASFVDLDGGGPPERAPLKGAPEP